ncbi:DUF262 domain-containing protein [Pseudokineococcus lusitanus]|uniref:DUF262 domain-containing protein n=1 Tax=Pseudokineococcus lusitanus TaxID=763993 RepID=UPI00131A06C6|nr:DUF262 domain-containing protein [Pseudokineococcus lusitanus]
MQWFLEIAASGQLDLDPAYQRRSVWNDDYRRFYIDTVLRDYPSPAIFLQVETRAGAPTVYHVIDGKQRLEALIRFSKGEFHLAAYFDDAGLSDPYYEDLRQEEQDAFADYVLSVENIDRAEDAELKVAFDRLNRNVAKLNRQELRKAQYEGAFISKMTELAAAPFWEDITVATRARVQRMLDVEFVSDLYLLTMKGVQDGSGYVMDDAYADYDAEIPDEQEHDRAYVRTLSFLESLPLQWRYSRWKNLSDLYGLWAAVLLVPSDDLPSAQEAAERLNDFESAINRFDNTSMVREYYDAVRQGSNKEASRLLRAEILRDVLLGETAEAPASASVA